MLLKRISCRIGNAARTQSDVIGHPPRPPIPPRASKIMSFSQGLHLVTLLWSLVEVHSQTTTPFISFQGNTLANHSYVDFSEVGQAADRSDSIRCRSELSRCCSEAQGDLRGDWFFPSGVVLPFPGLTNDSFEGRGAQTVDLRCISALSPSGIYRCDIAFDSDEPLARETFYTTMEVQLLSVFHLWSLV